MRVLEVLVLVSVAVITCSATYYEGQPCKPSSPEICKSRYLASKYTGPAGHGYGVNVCKTTYNYEKKAYSYTYQRVCRYYWNWWRYSYHCSYQCKKTNNCNQVYTKSSVSYHCCDGYSVAPSHSSWRGYYSLWTLKRYGCPQVVLPTLIDCVEYLQLTTLYELLNDTDVSLRLGAPSQMLTLLAPSEQVFNSTDIELYLESSDDLERFLSYHVLNKEVLSKKFSQGQTLSTILPGFKVHVSVIPGTEYDPPDQTGIFINGARIEDADACFAENGVVHVVNSFVKSSDRTITQIVRDTDELTIFSYLLERAGIASLLDQPERLRSLLAPTNDAFRSLMNRLQLDIVSCLKNTTDRNLLNRFVVYHVLQNVEFLNTLVTRSEVKTKVCYASYCYFYKCVYECKKIVVNVDNTGVVLGPDRSPISYPDIPAVNGVIHHVSYPIVNPWINLTEACSGFGLGSILIPPPPLVPPPP